MINYQYTKDPLELLFEHLPKTDDPTLVILKGHLLIEELLNNFLEIIFIEPEELWNARLTFDQRLSILKAFGILNNKYFDFYKAVKKLNRIRNEIAHNLDDKRLNDLIIDFIYFCKDERDTRKTTNEELIKDLKMSIILLNINLNGYLTNHSTIKFFESISKEATNNLINRTENTSVQN